MAEYRRYLLFLFFGAGIVPINADAGVCSAIPRAFQKIAALRERLSRKTEHLRSTALIHLDAKSFQIFEDYYLRQKTKHELSLSDADRNHLQERGLLPLFTAYEKTGKLVKRINHFLALKERAGPLLPPPTGWKSWMGVLEFLLPILPSPRRGYDRLLYDQRAKGKSLEPHQKKWLKRRGLENDIERYVVDRQRHPTAFARLDHFRVVKNIAIWGFVIGLPALNAALENQGSAEEVLDEAMALNAETRDKVEIIYLADLPEAYLRVGNVAYDFNGLRTERVSAVHRGNISDAVQEVPDLRDILVDEKTGVIRNFSTVELNLTRKEKYELQTLLRREVGQLHFYLPIANDALAEIHRNLAQTTSVAPPTIINRSREATLAWFKLQKLLGNKSIGPITSTSSAPKGMAGESERLLDSYFFVSYGPKLLFVAPFIDAFAN